MKYLVTFLFLSPLFFFSQKELIVQGEVVNVRKIADVKGEVVTKVKRFDRLTIVETGKVATVNGITDNWYKVKTETGKVGYVFGHFTSLKREGQITQVMTLNDISWGDCFLLVFDDIDFGSAMNDLGVYWEQIEKDSFVDDKVMVGTVFNVTYNQLFAQQYEVCDYNNPWVLIQTPTIIQIEKIE